MSRSVFVVVVSSRDVSRDIALSVRLDDDVPGISNESLHTQSVVGESGESDGTFGTPQSENDMEKRMGDRVRKHTLTPLAMFRWRYYARKDQAQ